MTTLITGASKGIGLALAYEFARHGHDLVLVSRDEARLSELTEKLRTQFKIKANFQVCDLSKPGSAIALYHGLKDQGVQINCLVNNAGIGDMGPYAEMSINTLHDLMQINMVSLSELTRHYLNDFVSRNEGSILQVASTAAFQPGPLMAAYYASKAYVVSLSQAIAYEIQDTKVSISILCPGATQTNFFPGSGLENSRLGTGSLGMMNPEKVAKIAYKGFQKKKLFIIPGLIHKFLSYLATIAPKRIVVKIVIYLHHKKNI